MSVMGLWCRGLTEKDIFTAVYEVTILTHTNPLVIHCNSLYCLIIKYQSEGLDPKNAYEKAKLIYLKESIVRDGIEDFSAWLKELDQGLLPKASYNMGHVKIALLHSLNISFKGLDFTQSMKEMLSQKGDTDTNCCILGALLNFSSPPTEYVNKVLQFDGKSRTSHPRPSFILPKNIFTNLITFFDQLQPRELILISSSK